MSGTRDLRAADVDEDAFTIDNNPDRYLTLDAIAEHLRELESETEIRVAEAASAKLEPTPDYSSSLEALISGPEMVQDLTRTPPV
ncbi:MAG: hypothetical protein ABIT38_23275 [Gemmatimonadaceae bacterium]